MTAASPVTAGWPWTYYSSAERSRTSDAQISLQAAVLNLAALVSLALLLGFGSEVLARQADIRASYRHRVLQIAGGMAAVAGVAIFIFSLTVWPKRAEIRDRVDLWKQYGSVELTPWKGGSVIKYLPVALEGRLSDPRAVRLFSPSQAALDQLGLTASLQSITLIETDLLQSDLERLAALPALKQLRLVDCPLTDAHCLAIASLPVLESLEVLHCKGADRLFECSIGLNRVIDLHVNDLSWSVAMTIVGGWGNGLQNLRLGILDAHSDYELKIADHNDLKHLTVYQSGEVTADAALTLRLTRMPNLVSVTLPSTLPIRFAGAELRRLQTVAPAEMGPDRISPPKKPLKFQSLSLVSAPSLLDIHCDGDWLRDISLRGTPSLQLLGLTPAAKSERRGELSRRASEKTVALHGSELIRQLAACDGPDTLDLSGLPLFGVDLSPLVAMGRIRNLSLARTGANASQVRSLSGLTRLKSLDIWYCDIRDGDIETILASFPLLQSLKVQSDHLTRLEVVNHFHLQQLLGSPWDQLKSLVVTGCPNLTGFLSVGHALEKIEIQDAGLIRLKRTRW